MYRHVDVLNDAGLAASVLHVKRDFACTWFAHTTAVASMATTTPGQSDVVVIPEIFGHRMATMFSDVRKVILNQNCYLTFEGFSFDYAGGYPYDNVLAVIAVSEDTEAYLKFAFPACRVLRVTYAIDPARFFFSSDKKRQIAFMPRKNEHDARQVVHVLKAHGIDYEFAPIDGASEEETARILRESQVYLSFGHPEGFGLPAAEAMACGCTVIGYHGMGGREFFKPPHAYPVAVGDIRTFVETVESVLDQDLEGQRRAASAFILGRYTPERERESVVTCWRAILDPSGRDGVS